MNHSDVLLIKNKKMLVKNTKTATKEIKLQLPVDIANSIPDNEIISLFTNKALTKVEY